jgi:acetyl-CoA carboxylase biotin carboxyl carrier protein
MNLKEIKDIIKLICDNDIAEIDIERSGERLRIRRNGGGDIRTKTAPAQSQDAVPEDRELLAVTSPLVGTFYRSPSLDSPPFIEVGSEVRKGDILCIVESMKLMNEIEAEFDGVVVSILVENGQSVEYGQTLFLVEPL